MHSKEIQDLQQQIRYLLDQLDAANNRIDKLEDEVGKLIGFSQRLIQRSSPYPVTNP